MTRTNARVYTVEARRPWAEAVAIQDGRIVAVGSEAQVGTLRTAATRVVDVGRRLVLPAFGDAHVHPLFRALRRSHGPPQDGKTLAASQKLLANCLTSAPRHWATSCIGS